MFKSSHVFQWFIPREILFNQEEPDTAAIKYGRLRILHTMEADVVVLAVMLTQEMYDVVDELRRTDMFSYNHRLGHDINLSETRRKQRCGKLL